MKPNNLVGITNKYSEMLLLEACGWKNSIWQGNAA
jgi:hypothetical protein